MGSPPPKVSACVAVAVLWGCCFPKGPSPAERLRAGCLASPACVLRLGEEGLPPPSCHPPLSRGQTQVPAMLRCPPLGHRGPGGSRGPQRSQQSLWPGLGEPQPSPPCLLLTQSSVGEGLPCDPPSCPHGPVTREVAGQTAAAVPRGPRLLQLRGPEACRPPHSHVWCPPGPGSRGRKGSEQPDVLWGPCPRGEGSWHWGPPRLMPSGLASRLRSPEQPPHPRLPSAPSEASQLAGHPSVREAMRVPRTGRRAGGPGLPAPWCGVAKGSLAAGPGRQQCPGVGAQAEGFSGSGPQPSLAHATVWPGALPQ